MISCNAGVFIASYHLWSAGNCGFRAGRRAGTSIAACIYCSIRQHTANSIRQRSAGTSIGACSIRHTSVCVSIRQHISAYVSIRQLTSAYGTQAQVAHIYLYLYLYRVDTSIFISPASRRPRAQGKRPRRLARTYCQGKTAPIKAPLRQYMYFCTGNASKLSTGPPSSMPSTFCSRSIVCSAVRQYLYCCTSTASKLSTCCRCLPAHMSGSSSSGIRTFTCPIHSTAFARSCGSEGSNGTCDPPEH